MRHNHVEDGDRVIVADVQTGDGVPTIYARFGDLPIIVLALACQFAALWFGRRPQVATSSDRT